MYHAAMRVDHVLLAVANLDRAIETFRDRLGMRAFAGGVHPGRGTHNGLIHFGSAYVELIAAHDTTHARAQTIARHVATGDAPYTFAVALLDIGRELTGLGERGLMPGPIRDGSRETPDGQRLRWQAALLAPGPSVSPEFPEPPFVIEWIRDENGMTWLRERVSLATHALPYGRLHAIVMASNDPPDLAAQFVRHFGWEITARQDWQCVLRTPNGDHVNPEIGPAPAVVIAAPRSEGDAGMASMNRALRRRIERHGPGFVGIAIETADLDAVVTGLRERSVRVEEHGDRYATIDPDDAHGALIEIVST
ncbi:MAG: hypothetical protein EPO26_02100 [Chloroflexota bacterium]|nr:MAG: hypothetical protein EPO26_02100 [Chloroflexota bacterium]